MRDTASNVGVRVAVKNDDGMILAVSREDGDGLVLPGGPVREGETSHQAAARVLEEQTGLEADVLTQVHFGLGDKFYHSTAYIALAGDEVDPRPEEGAQAEFVGIPDVLCGRWGLFARDAFNASGWMNRPAMELGRLYEITKKARRSGSEHATEGVDIVIDEVVFLTEIGKPGAIDAHLRDLVVEDVHPDILDAMRTMVEDVAGLVHKRSFDDRVDEYLKKVDVYVRGRKYKLVGDNGQILSKDVRGDAKKIYRRKAKEFGRMLRDGTLAKKHPGRHRGGRAVTRVSTDATFDEATRELSADDLKRGPWTN